MLAGLRSTTWYIYRDFCHEKRGSNGGVGRSCKAGTDEFGTVKRGRSGAGGAAEAGWREAGRPNLAGPTGRQGGGVKRLFRLAIDGSCGHREAAPATGVSRIAKLAKRVSESPSPGSAKGQDYVTGGPAEGCCTAAGLRV